MASLSTDAKGLRRVLFIDAGGRRRTIRLGRMDKRQAEAVRSRIELLVSAAMSRHAPDRDTVAWVSDLDDVLYRRLARVDLVRPREGRQLGQWIDHYMQSRPLKPESKRKLKQTRQKLVACFGEACRLHEISPDDAARWAEGLTGLSAAARKTHIGNAKTIFAEAVRREIIHRSPFAALKGGVTPAQDVRYVTREEILHMIEAAPSTEWKLLLGLARFAGLRVPSESHLLTWADVDFENDRLHVRSPKTERFPGKERRVVPIVRDLAKLLELRFAEVEEGETRLVTIRSAGARRRKMLAIAKAAGVELWSDAWQSLRRSAEIDFAREFPAFATAKWLGHSPTVALRHYMTAVPDDMFQRATGRQAAQNPAQTAPASGQQAQTQTARAITAPGGKSGGGGALQPLSAPDRGEAEWSRGESNPRPEAVSLAPLRVCPMV